MQTYTQQLIIFALIISIGPKFSPIEAAWDASFEASFPGYGSRSVSATADDVFVGSEDGRIWKWQPSIGWSAASNYFIDGGVQFLARRGNYLYFAGDFVQVADPSWNWFTVNRVGRLRLSDGVIEALPGGGITGGPIYTMIVMPDSSSGTGDFLYVGGRFSGAGGGAAQNIARWNGTRWDNMLGGLSMGAQPPYVMDGVHSITVDTTYPSYPNMIPYHRIVASGHFEVGPNIAVFWPTISFGGTPVYSWDPVRTGIANITISDEWNCTWSNSWAQDSAVQELCRVSGGLSGGSLVMLTIFVNRIDTYYIITEPEPNLPCGAAIYFGQARGALSSPYSADLWNISLNVWDGSQGWGNFGPSTMVYTGSALRALGFAEPGGYRALMVYTWPSGPWVEVTSLSGGSSGWSRGPSAISHSSLGTFLATYPYPRRWN